MSAGSVPARSLDYSPMFPSWGIGAWSLRWVLEMALGIQAPFPESGFEIVLFATDNQILVELIFLCPGDGHGRSTVCY